MRVALPCQPKAKPIIGSNVESEHKKRPCIVLIDDEELVLSALRMLLDVNGDFHVIEFTDPLRALEELKRRPVDIVVSDHMMPDINGVDLLKQARSLQPEAMRILLTGFADKHNAIRALNEAAVYQYLEKPWDNDQFLMVLQNALREKSLRQQLADKVSILDRLITEHHELTARQRYLERELEMAARVQRSLLPSCFPEIPGLQIHSAYRPCQALGGDYFDFARRKGQTWILVSDVSGHGIQAALTSMLIKAIFHDASAGADDPAQLFAEMNARLNRFLPDGTYAAAAAVSVDERNGMIRLVNAGLPYPFVLRAGNRRLDQIPLAGIPLGMFSGSDFDSYEVRPIDLAAGDILLVASDGLSETQAEDGKFFGDCQLRKVLDELNGSEGSELISKLMERADQFRGSQRSTDDVVVVTLTRTFS